MVHDTLFDYNAKHLASPQNTTKSPAKFDEKKTRIWGRISRSKIN